MTQTNSKKYYSTQQETRVANYLGWRPVSGSGARACLPGDITSDEWLGECKTHVKPQVTVDFYVDHWRKIKDEAVSRAKGAVLVCDTGTQIIEDTWCIYSARFDLDFITFAEHPTLDFNGNLHLDPSMFDKSKVYKVRSDSKIAYLSHVTIFKQLLEGGC